jgi:hypothetical protein
LSWPITSDGISDRMPSTAESGRHRQVCRGAIRSRIVVKRPMCLVVDPSRVA